MEDHLLKFVTKKELNRIDPKVLAERARLREEREQRRA